MAAIAQTIAIVDRSGKVVSTSKQLKNVFLEAKLAYQERKAEIKAERRKTEERELHKALRAVSIADTEERSEYTRRSKSHHHKDGSRRRRRNSDESSRPGGISKHRHPSSGSVRQQGSSRTSPQPRSPGSPVGLAQFNQELYGDQQPRSGSFSGQNSPIAPGTPVGAPQNQLLRRRTDHDVAVQYRSPYAQPPLQRSYTTPGTPENVDMDLAYGEFHAPDLAPTRSLTTTQPEKELTGLVQKCNMLLDEANCAQHSVKAIIQHLQSNPDAMAAVALTLAEISNIASKMAPGALAAMKTSAPAVFALLTAPQFLIAVGVGVGVTVVMFGGYKIIKKIKETNLLKEGVDPLQRGTGPYYESNGEELIDVQELDRIEQWRRGIADTQLQGINQPRLTYRTPSGNNQDAETATVISGYSGTSVEGEFITPFAERSMGHLPLKSSSSTKTKDKDKSKKKEKKEGKDRKEGSKKREKTVDGGSVSGSTSGSVSGGGGGSGNARDKQLIKVKKPSPLRKLFTTHTVSSEGRVDNAVSMRS